MQMVQFLPRGWHRSPAGRWLLVSDHGQALVLVDRLAREPGQAPAWSWRSSLPAFLGLWWGSQGPDLLGLTLERACKALREKQTGQAFVLGPDPKIEQQILTRWSAAA